ncbi:MAG: DUF2126 domain-containing protein [Gammaproteobacteria bacterium]
MSIKVAIHHHTEYRYDRLVHLSPQVARLRPAPHSRTAVLSYSLKVEPSKHFINWQQDPFGNYLARLVFPERVRQLTLDVDIIADMTVINPFDFFLDEGYRHFPFQYPAELARQLEPYLDSAEAGSRLKDWLAKVPRERQPMVDFLVDLNRRLQSDIQYLIRFEPGVQSSEETLARASGSCRDSGWLLVDILRHLGLAARFVSGYLVQLTPDQKPVEGAPGPSQDFTDLHAWAEVFVPGGGWLGLDPTSGLFAGEGHIPLACTPEPASAAPLTGITESCESQFSYHNRVQRLPEDARVTKPYTDTQWQAIVALGEAVDTDLKRHDCRLTMGGEPTFVSIDDMDGAQWNTEALGERKHELAASLCRRLQARFAPGGLLHFGQAKWYPGEALPRWALACFWRTDGEPVWNDPELIADEARHYGHDSPHAESFVSALTERLMLDPKAIIPGFEDPYYYLWREAKLPVNEDPFNSNLADPLERKRLARLLDRGLDKTTGYVLPIRWLEDLDADGWQTGRPWPMRRERLYLIPGDSPMGFRLPLESLPWVPLLERDVVIERDPFAARPPLPLPPFRGRKEDHASVPAHTPPGVQRARKAADVPTRDYVRTALCVEPREGRLHVFMPPLEAAEAYLYLIAAVEATAAELELPLIVEGYPPPSDPRLRHFMVTPDPGVIEVNVHPAQGWGEVVDITTILYEEARAVRLGTEKFNLDGRHVGTGGGNHVVLGGPTATESPFLRRPDLLQRLLTYWQHHPSLSYLFSGLFVGPTSQAPRVDEARDDSLHELEIAFQQIPQGEIPRPWVVDRLLRNVLIDVTGNTHRTEFCIDKLYSPDGPGGRRGLVEFRGFEMPPHGRMSCVQMLLLRALVAHFWCVPYRRRPARWGTALHDRYALPHFLWLDFEDVLAELQEAGYPFELDWYLPFFEFRFPHLGQIVVRGMELELRMAIEPWHVLGEEVQAGGMARYVDSSVERLQIEATGLNPERYCVACNGRRVPLKPTAVAGHLVAGVRYKAWQPPSGLHPLIPAHSPLTFDLVDIAAARSIGGCTYHVAHPGGRHYDTFPVNAAEAEARRSARFFAHGHSQGQMPVPVEETHPEYPCTLDLRTQAP